MLFTTCAANVNQSLGNLDLSIILMDAITITIAGVSIQEKMEKIVKTGHLKMSQAKHSTENLRKWYHLKTRRTKTEKVNQLSAICCLIFN